MVNRIKSYLFAFKYVFSFATKKVSSNCYTEILEEYKGLDGNQVPMKIFYSKIKTKKTVIIFLGASPDGENHKSINLLGKIMAKLGYNVFVPRIPPLKKLDISNENVDWIAYLYEMIQERSDVDSEHIIALGISYGGGMLLKASLDDRMVNSPPKSIYLYGAGCNAETILKFITKGEFEVDGKINKIKPHDWGLTVFFHHFMKDIDFGFDKKNIEEVINLRIDDEKIKAKEKIKQLSSQEFDIANPIITGEINDKVQLIVNDVLKVKRDYIENLSCKSICQDITSKVFILHGANDSMIPFTEAVQLNALIPSSELLVSYLFEHKGISGNRGLLFKLKELLRLVNFLSKFYRYNEN